MYLCGKKIKTLLCLLFIAQNLLAQNANDLIISELMANPKPSQGLPEKEYLEIYNRTDKAISLNGLKLLMNSSTQILPNISILPKEYATICEKIDEKTFAVYGKVVVVNAITLANTGATVSLKDAKNKTIFSITYTDKWYAANKNAGYALEIIDTNYPCVEEANWTSSEAKEGGTPAKENSVKANKPDLMPPSILRYEISNSTTLKLIFSEKLDSLAAVSKLAYSIDNNLIINKLAIESPANLNVNITLNSAIQDNIIYTLSVKNIQDCSGNLLKESQIKFGNSKPADSSDVVINEVLFNPRTGGEDFVEIYNRTEKLLSLKDWSLANIDKNGKIADIKKITVDNFILLPKKFLVLSKNNKTVQSQYAKAVAENFLEIASLPSYNDDESSVILLNDKNKVFDRVDYSAKWHSVFLDDVSGVSLERKNYNLPTNDKNNWQSAAASEGFATPGYANSQGISDVQKGDEGFTISPEIFTPDGDGQNETTKLNYKFSSAGNFASIKIFDINGRLMRQLIDNQALSTNGSLEWDGTDGSHNVVSVGYYIVFIELYNANGEVKSFKEKVVVGSKY
jgi:Lamin Tail Domain